MFLIKNPKTSCLQEIEKNQTLKNTVFLLDEKNRLATTCSYIQGVSTISHVLIDSYLIHHRESDASKWEHYDAQRCNSRQCNRSPYTIVIRTVSWKKES